MSSESLREEGKEYFRQKKFAQAKAKFTDALKVDGENAILYANRSACNYALCQYEEAISDARKATGIDSQYIKGWHRLATACEAVDDHGDSIEAWEKALELLPGPSSLTVEQQQQKARCECDINAAKSKILDPDHISLETAIAMANAHNISIPPPHTHARLPEVKMAYLQHPKARQEPPMHFLVIPESVKEPIHQVTVQRNDNTQARIARLIGCRFTGSALLHSEDQVAYKIGKPNGVGVGRLHRSFEIFMDDNALSQRRRNERASVLLHATASQPLHGTILLMKTVFIKSSADMFGRSADIIGWERVNESYLRSPEWRDLRLEWIGLGGR
ncbi:uncharacterized protein EV420DRAFT_1560799 [Desarmillaria tabescens]|uniref:TPR-like protein n=1 Tax=Armillaria tabescens TaxID=1929756 RepID=A0AA39JYR1_ARMTA|nr:uncharacterized protein EV420DRAFT_1560799 [Desarmillaria tabescens]KAK0451401.1 hypothetical protein EV420DRAFT_1560799 [Desarmillaria tabescens]